MDLITCNMLMVACVHVEKAYGAVDVNTLPSDWPKVVHSYIQSVKGKATLQKTMTTVYSSKLQMQIAYTK